MTEQRLPSLWQSHLCREEHERDHRIEVDRMRI